MTVELAGRCLYLPAWIPAGTYGHILVNIAADIARFAGIPVRLLFHRTVDLSRDEQAQRG